MGSQVIATESYFLSTDVGFVRTDVISVVGFDIEDLVHDRAMNQARRVLFLNLGKTIDPTKPIASRTMASVWLNNTEDLL
jgi:hypothetical protein